MLPEFKITQADIAESYRKVQMIDYMTFIHRPWYKRLWAWIKGLFGYPKAAIIYMTKNRHAEVNCEETWCDGCKRFSKGPYCPNCR